MIENGQQDGEFILNYSGENIPFHIEFRKRSRLAITVHPNQQVEVAAPRISSLNQVLTKVEKRAGWILKQRRFFEQFQPTQPSRQYVSGETHVYLGRQYRLKVLEGTPQSAKLIGRFLHIHTSGRDNREKVKRLVEEWYRQHGRLVLLHRLQVCLDSAASLGLKKSPKLIIRQMIRRWGSCTRAGTILLNVDLVKVPVHCIDYVIMHELCHLKIRSHSEKFYQLLTRCMPDWRKRKARLEEIVLH